MMDVSEFCLGSFGVSGNCCRDGCPDSIASARSMVSCHQHSLFDDVGLSSPVGEVVSFVGVPWWISIIFVVIQSIVPCRVELLALWFHGILGEFFFFCVLVVMSNMDFFHWRLMGSMGRAGPLG